MPVAACWMLGVSCNRGHNAFQLDNSVIFLAGGVSERVNDYLRAIGLSASREVALKAMDTLRAQTEENL